MTLFPNNIAIKVEGSHSVLANVLHSNIVVSEFQLKSLYYVYFSWQRHEPTYPLSNRLNSTTTILLQEWH